MFAIWLIPELISAKETACIFTFHFFHHHFPKFCNFAAIPLNHFVYLIWQFNKILLLQLFSRRGLDYACLELHILDNSYFRFKNIQDYLGTFTLLSVGFWGTSFSGIQWWHRCEKIWLGKVSKDELSDFSRFACRWSL